MKKALVPQIIKGLLCNSSLLNLGPWSPTNFAYFQECYITSSQLLRVVLTFCSWICLFWWNPWYCDLSITRLNAVFTWHSETQTRMLFNTFLSFELNCELWIHLFSRTFCELKMDNTLHFAVGVKPVSSCFIIYYIVCLYIIRRVQGRNLRTLRNPNHG